MASLGLSYSLAYHVLPELDDTPKAREKNHYSRARCFATAAVMTCLNFVNFMDRSIYGSIVDDVKTFYAINDTQAGLIQTVYVCSMIVAAPIASYVGRRYSRKWTILIGVAVWASAVLAAPFVPRGHFAIFLMIRSIAGVGESCLGTLALTVYADLFSPEQRPLLITIYSISTSFGSGFAFVFGSLMKESLDGFLGQEGWTWVGRFPGLLAIPILLCAVIIIPDVANPKETISFRNQISYSRFADVAYLLECKTYILVVMGHICMNFVLGSQSYWTVTILQYASYLNSEIDKASVGSVVGLAIITGGAAGIIIFGELSRRLVKLKISGAQPTVAGIASVFGGIMMFFFITFSRSNAVISYTFLVVCSFCLNAGIPTIPDTLLAISPPFARPMAFGVYSSMSHLLGDGFSPLLIGVMTDSLNNNKTETYNILFTSLSTSFTLAEFAAAFGGICYLTASLTMTEDMRKVAVFNRTTTFVSERTTLVSQVKHIENISLRSTRNTMNKD